MKILEFFGVNENNPFSKRMEELCHKCVVAHSSRTNDVQFELAASWALVSNTPSFLYNHRDL